jgi:hypothetical protein
MAEKIKEPPEKIKQLDDDKPDYQEKIMFLVSTTAQGAILLWCLIVLSLGYIKLPNKLFGMDIPDQPRVDSTFAAGQVNLMLLRLKLQNQNHEKISSTSFYSIKYALLCRCYF